MSHFPVALKKVSQSELGIRWDDQKETSLTVRKLRLECPCASCIDEWTREKLLKDPSWNPGILTTALQSSPAMQPVPHRRGRGNRRADLSAIYH